MFDQLRKDYRRHGSRLLYPPFWAVCNYRFGNWAFRLQFPPVRWLASKMYGLIQFILLITSGIQINREARIGRDLHLLHSGCIIIHPDAVIGDRCGILHEVTIGTNMKSGAPTIGNDVFIGAGAIILGNITIGDNATIAANSLVIDDVPPGCTAIGVPAKIIKRRDPSQRYVEVEKKSK